MLPFSFPSLFRSFINTDSEKFLCWVYSNSNLPWFSSFKVSSIPYLLKALHRLVHQRRHLHLWHFHLSLYLLVLTRIFLQRVQIIFQRVEILLFSTLLFLDQWDCLQEFLWELQWDNVTTDSQYRKFAVVFGFLWLLVWVEKVTSSNSEQTGASQVGYDIH